MSLVAYDRNEHLLVSPTTQRIHVPDVVVGVTEQDLIKDPAVSCGEQAPSNLNQVGGRGFLTHPPTSIPRRAMHRPGPDCPTAGYSERGLDEPGACGLDLCRSRAR